MSKQKAKDSKTNNNQKKHNSSTKGINTSRRGPLWSIRKALLKNRKTGETKEINVEVRVPPNTLYDPELGRNKNLPEPFDAIKLDWAEEVAGYLLDGYKLEKKPLEDGRFEYRVKGSIETGGGIKEYTVFTIVSKRNAFMESRPRRKRRRNHKKKES